MQATTLEPLEEIMQRRMLNNLLNKMHCTASSPYTNDTTESLQSEASTASPHEVWYRSFQPLSQSWYPWTVTWIVHDNWTQPAATLVVSHIQRLVKKGCWRWQSEVKDNIHQEMLSNFLTISASKTEKLKGCYDSMTFYCEKLCKAGFTQMWCIHVQQ